MKLSGSKAMAQNKKKDVTWQFNLQKTNQQTNHIDTWFLFKLFKWNVVNETLFNLYYFDH